MEGMLNYFVPEDGDSADHMNVVPLPRVDQLKLQHIKKSFPLPGDFHFRFKTAFEGTYVWLDVTNDADPIPDYNGLIVSKISRVQRESSTRPPERVETKNVAPPQQTKPQPTPDLIETSSPPPAKRDEPAAPAKAFNDDLVGLLADPVPATSPRPTAAPTPVQAAPTQGPPPGQDPFNLFLGPAANNTPMRPPNAPGMGPGAGGPRGPIGPGAGGPGGFNPMGGAGPRPTGGMNISQMGQHMGMPGGPPQGQAGNSFSGLQWQGMGQQPQPPRPGMGGGRQW